MGLISRVSSRTYRLKQYKKKTKNGDHRRSSRRSGNNPRENGNSHYRRETSRRLHPESNKNHRLRHQPFTISIPRRVSLRPIRDRRNRKLPANDEKITPKTVQRKQALHHAVLKRQLVHAHEGLVENRKHGRVHRVDLFVAPRKRFAKNRRTG